MRWVNSQGLGLRVHCVSQQLCLAQQTFVSHLLFHLQVKCLFLLWSLKSLSPASSSIFSWRWYSGWRFHSFCWVPKLFSSLSCMHVIQCFIFSCESVWHQFDFSTSYPSCVVDCSEHHLSVSSIKLQKNVHAWNINFGAKDNPGKLSSLPLVTHFKHHRLVELKCH